MSALLDFIQGPLQKYLNPQFHIHWRDVPRDLLKDLSSSSGRKRFLSRMKNSTNDAFRIMRKLTVCHLVLLYSEENFDLIGAALDDAFISKDVWLNQNFLSRYQMFLRKYAASRDMVIKCRTPINIPLDHYFESAFFIANMLRGLIQCVLKMPLLGRYFNKDHGRVVTCYVQIIALQASRLYQAMAKLLHAITNNPQRFIVTPDDQNIIKALFGQELIVLNQEMKKLLLDKYFHPYGKGIGVKLYRIEDLPPDQQHTITAILNDHMETNRRKRMEELQQTLFPIDGSFDLNAYHQSILSKTFTGLPSVNTSLNGTRMQGIDEIDIDINLDSPIESQSDVGKHGESGKATAQGLTKMDQVN